jgi:hypothetical protein
MDEDEEERKNEEVRRKYRERHRKWRENPENREREKKRRKELKEQRSHSTQSLPSSSSSSSEISQIEMEVNDPTPSSSISLTPQLPPSCSPYKNEFTVNPQLKDKFTCYTRHISGKVAKNEFQKGFNAFNEYSLSNFQLSLFTQRKEEFSNEYIGLNIYFSLSLSYFFLTSPVEFHKLISSPTKTFNNYYLMWLQQIDLPYNLKKCPSKISKENIHIFNDLLREKGKNMKEHIIAHINRLPHLCIRKEKLHNAFVQLGENRQNIILEMRKKRTYHSYVEKVCGGGFLCSNTKKPQHKKALYPLQN